MALSQLGFDGFIAFDLNNDNGVTIRVHVIFKYFRIIHTQKITSFIGQF